MVAPAHRIHYTRAEYLALEASSNVKHEYLDGQIYGMAGGTPEHAALKATESARRTQLEQASLDLYAELRDDLRTLELGTRQVRAAAKFRELAREALESEQRKFINGTSNNFVVAQRQADLASARQDELTALIGHRKSSTALDAAMGVLLEERGVQLDAPR